MTTTEIRAAVSAVRGDAERLLCELIRVPPCPRRGARVDCAASGFQRGAVERIPLSDDLLKDEDYSDPVAGLHYDGRSNLRRAPRRRVARASHCCSTPQSRCGAGLGRAGFVLRS